MKALLSKLLLPSQITEFEARHLARMNRIALWFFVAHLPVFVLFAYLNHTQPVMVGGLTLAVLAGPVIARRTFRSPRSVSLVYGVTAMFMGGILVHVGQGPMQIEMHFYFFALLAMLAVFGNPLVILVATATVALHHLGLWFVVPRSVFNYDAPVWVVAVHAAFVVLEAGASCYIARSFFDNVIGLEKIVRTRTSELDGKNRDLRLVLDNVKEGLLTLDLDGRMSAERSAAVERCLGPAPEGDDFAAYLDRADADAATRFRVGWTQLVEDVLPVEMCLDQLPARCSVGGRELSLAWSPIVSGGRLERVLVVISDVTAEIERERLEREQGEVAALFHRLLRDRQGLLEFYQEASSQVRTVGESEIELTHLRRLIHTIKGNAGIFGLHSVAEICHDLETVIDEEKAAPSPVARERLTSRWRAVCAHVESFLGDRDGSTVEVAADELAQAIAAARRGEPARELAARMERWRLEPLARRFGRVAEQATGIARRLNKGDLDIRIDDGGTRIDLGAWSSFWSSFIHAVRNAVDHGLEAPDEREAQSKPQRGRLELSARRDPDGLVIEIADDGRGIDWDAVRQRAARLGLPVATRDDLIEALFVDGLTTASSVSEYSGRGIGMGAIREACSARGGSLTVVSERGEGTRLQFRFPERTAAETAA